MTILEADVFWSDILLGITCVILGRLLQKQGNNWSRLFYVLSLATFFGAFYHGLINHTASLTGDILWTTTLFWFALTSIVMIDEAFERNKKLRVFLLPVLAGYMYWAIFVSEAFLWALALQGIAVITLAIRYFSSFRKKQSANKSRLDWLFIGFLAVNILAIVLQQLKINFGLPVSHNTVFHIIELPVMLLLFYFLRGLHAAPKPRR